MEDLLEKKQIDVSRGLHYQYYTNSNSTPVSTSSPALLLTHGFPDGAELWQFIVPHLLPLKNKIIVPHLLGYGGTSKPTDPKEFEISAMCQDVVEILKAEGITQDNTVLPIGHDWGAYYSQRLYMLQPKLSCGLVTMSVAVLPPARDKFDLEAVNKATTEIFGYPMYAYWYLFLPHEGAKLIDSRLESFWYALHGDKPAWMKEMFCVPGAMREFIEKDRRDIPLKPYGKNEKLKSEWMAMMDPAKGGGGMLSPTNWYRALEQDIQLPAESKLGPNIDKPYLFFGLQHDYVNRADAIEQAKANGWAKNLTVRIIDSAHWVPYEKPDEVGNALVEWLKEKGFAKS